MHLLFYFLLFSFIFYSLEQRQTTDERHRREAGVQEQCVGLVPHIAQKDINAQSKTRS